MIEITGKPKSVAENEIEKIILDCFHEFNIDDNKLIEVIFASKQKIQDLNRQYRKINKPTDVLSFPQTEHHNNSNQILGSVVICEEIAKEYNEDVSDLIKHGFLHLLGYDHETNEQDWNIALNKLQD